MVATLFTISSNVLATRKYQIMALATKKTLASGNRVVIPIFLVDTSVDTGVLPSKSSYIYVKISIQHLKNRFLVSKTVKLLSLSVEHIYRRGEVR